MRPPYTRQEHGSHRTHQEIELELSGTEDRICILRNFVKKRLLIELREKELEDRAARIKNKTRKSSSEAVLKEPPYKNCAPMPRTPDGDSHASVRL